MQRVFFFYLALLLVLVIGLAACGGSGSASGSSGQAEAAPAQVEAVPTPAPGGDPAAGQEIFTSTCATCHGPAGEGVPGLGKDMTTSEFIAGKTDAELVEFIKVGRDPSDPLNTTGVAMPPKGGNPALSNEDLLDVAAYIRSLQK